MMAESTSLPEPPQRGGGGGGDWLELHKDLERMTENMENLSVLLTMMAYDMAALRTSPELWASMQKLVEAFDRCRAAVSGTREQQPGRAGPPEPTDTATTDM